MTEHYGLTDREHALYALAVLRAFSDADCHEGVIWHVRDGRVFFSAMCSDTFAWGTADAEPIDPADIPALDQCLKDLADIGNGVLYFLPELFASRKRGTRPMNRWMTKIIGDDKPEDAAVRALFEAAGPPRESVFGAP
jgi:hypothetical protein